MKRVFSVAVIAALLVMLTAAVALAATIACDTFGTCEGTSENDTIFGTNGVDDIVARAGKDVVLAQDGGDTVTGGSDKDDIRGGNGEDTLSGGKGPDKIAGDSGSDEMYGEEDNDTIYAADGEEDYIDCGEGTEDKAFVDQSDTVSDIVEPNTCETVETLEIAPPA